MTNPLEPDNDSDDSLLVNQQPSNPKLDDNNLIQQSTDVSTATSSDPSLIKEVFERPTLLPITQIDYIHLEPNIKQSGRRAHS